MRSSLGLLLAFLLIGTIPVARGATLPGFGVRFLGNTSGFLRSIAIDSVGTIYYTTTDGGVFLFGGPESTRVARVVTEATGDSGLLGMALRDDRTAIVHYTTPGLTDDVLSSIDLVTGAETVIRRFVCDISLPGRATSAEHHGGNPTIGADGSIFFGIGDYGGGAIAQLPEWNGGKIWRVTPEGTVVQFALGFRNPFGMAWDAERLRLIVGDNGPAVDDEIDVVTAGGDYGWPYTVGNEPPIADWVPPLYVFPTVVAPTGMIRLSGHSPLFRRGYLLGAYVAKAIYYIPDIDARPFPDPLEIIAGETGPIIAVAEGPNGDVYFGTGSAIYKLIVPLRGDCNGDGKVDIKDLDALRLEIADGGPHPAILAQDGAYRGSWGCDASGDGIIDGRDIEALAGMLMTRREAVGRK